LNDQFTKCCFDWQMHWRPGMPAAYGPRGMPVIYPAMPMPPGAMPPPPHQVH